MLKTEHFYYMLELYKAGSMNKAAENLYVSQAYLSKVLKELESELGVTLFTRSHKGLAITDAGKDFLACSKEFTELMNKIERLSAKYKIQRQKLVISTMYSFTMLDLFYNFAKLSICKEVDISYVEMQNRLITEHVLKGNSNIGILYLDSINEKSYLEELKKQGITFLDLYRDPLNIIVSKTHPLYQNTSVTLAELYPYSLIIENYKKTKDGFLKGNPFLDIFKDINIEPSNFDNNRSLLYYLTKSNSLFSLGQKSLNLGSPFVSSGELKYIPISDINIDIIIGAIYKSVDEKEPIQNKLINYLQIFYENYCKYSVSNFEIKM